MKIGELANKCGLTPKTVRFYEGEELLRAPSRTASGYRDYTNADVERLEFVKKASRVYLEAYTSILLVDQSVLVRDVAGASKEMSLTHCRRTIMDGR